MISNISFTGRLFLAGGISHYARKSFFDFYKDSNFLEQLASILDGDDIANITKNLHLEYDEYVQSTVDFRRNY